MTEEEAKSMGDLFPDLGPEAPVISGIAHDRSEALATVRGVPNEPGMAAKVFTELATAGVNVDMIVQNTSRAGKARISFTVHRNDVQRAKTALSPVLADFAGSSQEEETGIAKLSAVGIGMRSHSGVAAEMFAALASAGINIQMISTSEIKIAVTIPEDRAEEGARVVHAAFGLGK